MTSRLIVASALLGMASLPQCIQVTEGIEVDVAYQPAATPAQVRTDMGYRVHLERALIAVGKVELIGCDNFVRVLWKLVVPARALAHEFATPTSLGIPLVIDLMQSAGTAQFAGTLRPPPGRYCGIRVSAMPADDDAEGLTKQNLDMMLQSVLIEGQVEDLNTGSRTPLLTRISEVLQCEMLFDRPLVFDSPILESVSIQIDQKKWFDGIDFALQDSNAVQQRITENIRSSLRAVLPDTE
ncbi:MAG: hypothetical protein WCE62_07765 [Polyangiales bacterium]